jgi:hypothetical protein
MTDVLTELTVVDIIEVKARPDVIVTVAGPDLGFLEVTTTDVILVVPDVDLSGVVEVHTPGPQGVQGDKGVSGDIGPVGPSPMYEQVFATAALVWIVVHPLNTKPSVTTVDQNGDEVIGDVSFPDNSTVIISFGLPFAGTARLKA